MKQTRKALLHSADEAAAPTRGAAILAQRMKSVAIVVLCLTMNACDKEGDDDDGTYSVPDNISVAEAKTLIEDANKKLREVSKLTFILTEIEKRDGVNVSVKYEAQLDRDAKKIYEVVYRSVPNKPETLAGFSLKDGNAGKRHRYDLETDDNYNYANYPDGARKTYELTCPFTDAAKYYGYLKEYIKLEEIYSISVADGKIIAKGINSYSSGDTTTYEVSLNADKSYKQVKETTKYSGNTKERGRETTLRYSSSIGGLPSGLSESVFGGDNDQTSQYAEAKVEWGNGLGSNKFWVWHGGSASLSASSISEYAPDSAGYYVSGFQGVQGGYVTWTPDGTPPTFNAVWSAGAPPNNN